MAFDVVQELEDRFDRRNADFRARRIRRIVVDRMDPFRAMTQVEFIGRFRFTKETIRTLVDDIEGDLPETLDGRGSRVPPHLQVLIALGCIATGTHQNLIGDCYSVSQPTVSRCLKRVAIAIARLRPRYVEFPEDIEDTVRQFCTLKFLPTHSHGKRRASEDGVSYPQALPKGGVAGQVV